MPALNIPSAPHYIPAQPTTHDLNYADLAIIDLAKASSSEGRQQLAQEVKQAMSTLGFFYVINHGLTPEQTERIFDIADVPFTQVDPEEKQLYVAAMKETGSYQGYKPRQYWHIDQGVHDQVENYNINRDITRRQHPLAVRPFLPEIQQFAYHNHTQVLHQLLRLMALGLELPEETFVEMHGFSAVGETYVRFMKYHPRSEDDELRSKNVWLKGHTDFGTITILYSQPVTALQILAQDGTWKFIKHIENALVINAGDAMEFLSGGFYKATIHRVVQPPPDQRQHTRLGVFYFCMPDDSVTLSPLVQSPVLQARGIIPRQDKPEPTVEEWRRARTSAYGQSKLNSGNQPGVEEELIHGILVKHYN